MLLTIFTPVYNRGYLLEKLYLSLTKQTSFDFEWVVVDDGSTDNTREVMSSIIERARYFDVRYYYQQNHGKHAAINLGVEKAKGEAFFIVDSDDWLPDNAVSFIEKNITALDKTSQFAGIAGLKQYPDGKPIGTSFHGEFVDCSTLERSRNNITGDKAEVFFTAILKKFPFPVFDGENFLSEELVWARIANAGFKIRWYNEAIYCCEYLPDGLTNAKNKEMKNFEGIKLRTKELITYKEVPLMRKMKMILITGAIAIDRKDKLSDVGADIGMNGFLFILLAYLGWLVRRLRRRINRR